MSIVTKASNPELYNALFLEDEIKEIIDYLGNDKNYNCDCNDGSYYLELPYREAHELKDCITNLQEIKKEHSIMKQFIYENGLWEKLLNYDRFLDHLRSDDNE